MSVVSFTFAQPNNRNGQDIPNYIIFTKMFGLNVEISVDHYTISSSNCLELVQREILKMKFYNDIVKIIDVKPISTAEYIKRLIRKSNSLSLCDENRLIIRNQ